MFMSKNSFFIFACAFFLSACAVAPFSNHTTGRTNGAGQSHLVVGSTIGNLRVPVVKYDIGVLDNLDLGFDYEVATLGAQAKVGFMDAKSDGFAIAALAGAGNGGNGYYVYGGPAMSYKYDILEPYSVIRYNYVHFNSSQTQLGGLGTLSIPAGRYSYMMYTLGLSVMALDWLGFSGEYTFLGGTGSGTTIISRSGYPSAAVNFKF